MDFSNITSLVNDFPGGPILGGIPDNSDLAPSIVFMLAYIALLLVGVFRFFNHTLNIRLAFRPFLFCTIRVVTWILRIVIIKSSSISENLFIGEAVLLLLGLILLASPVLSLVTAQVQSKFGLDSPFMRVLGLCKLITIVALILSIVAATNISSAFSNSSDVSSIRTDREISSILLLVAIFLGTFITLVSLLPFFTANDAVPGTRNLRTAALLGILLPLNIATIYRIIQVYSPSESSTINLKVVFYIVYVLQEWLAAAGFFLWSWKTFNEDALPADAKDEQNDILNSIPLLETLGVNDLMGGRFQSRLKQLSGRFDILSGMREKDQPNSTQSGNTSQLEQGTPPRY